MLDRAVARAGYAVYQDGEQVGCVTSGAPSPSLKNGIGFTIVTSQTISEDDKIDIEIRGRMHPAKIVTAPFI
jgi:aminomethyltransferase